MMNDRLINRALLAVASLLTLTVIWNGVSYAWTAPLTELPGKKVADKEDDKAKKNPDDERAQRITQRNIFAPPKPKGFRGQLTGILGDRAIFNGSQSGKVGENVMGAKILDLGPDWAEIEFEGKKQKLWVFQPRK